MDLLLSVLRMIGASLIFVVAIGSLVTWVMTRAKLAQMRVAAQQHKTQQDLSQDEKNRLNRQYNRTATIKRLSGITTLISGIVAVALLALLVIMPYQMMQFLGVPTALTPRGTTGSQRSGDISVMQQRFKDALMSQNQQNVDALACGTGDANPLDMSFQAGKYAVEAMEDVTLTMSREKSSTDPYKFNVNAIAAIAGMRFKYTYDVYARKDSFGSFCLLTMGAIVDPVLVGARNDTSLKRIDGLEVDRETCGINAAALLDGVKQFWKARVDTEKKYYIDNPIASFAPLAYCAPGKQEEIYRLFGSADAVRAYDDTFDIGNWDYSEAAVNEPVSFSSRPYFTPKALGDYSPQTKWKLTGTLVADATQPGHYVLGGVSYSGVQK